MNRQVLKVGYLRNSLYLPSERFIPTQARAMGIPVVMMSRDPIVDEVDQLVSISLNVDSSMKRAAYTLAPRARLSHIVAELGLDILHAHFGVEGEQSVSTARDAGIPHFTTLHGFDVSLTERALLRSRKPAWIRYALRRRRFLRNSYSKFICVSNAVRDRAIELGADPEHCFVVANGVDTDSLQWSELPSSPRIAHVGRLVEKKGTEYLLRAMPRILRQAPGAQLVIVGDGPMRADLQSLALSLDILHAVDFVGSASHAVALDAIKASTILAVPSVTAASGDREGLPQVILEAAALGRPTVGTSHSGIPEAVIDGRTGSIVAERDIEALADAVGQLLADSGLASSMSTEARDLAVSEFSVTHSARRLEALYHTSVVSSGRRG